MNILQVIPQMHAGGAERTVIEVAQAIVAEGGKALVASCGGRLEPELDAVGATHIQLDMKTKNPISIWRNAARLSDVIKIESIDLIHARSRAPAWSALWAARRTHIPYVTTYHGVYTAKSGLKRTYNSVMARGDRVIANSEFTAAHVRTEHGVGDDRLRIIPRGVDLEVFDPATVTPDRIKTLRQSWGANPDQTTILLPGRITRWKGQSLLVEALSDIAIDPKPLLVCLGEAAGKHEYQNQLRAQAEAGGVDLSLPGHTSDMPAAYMAADLVVCPSLQPEAFGRVAAEAQAMGARVIVADHGGAREVVADSQTGWRAKPGDVEDWRTCIKTALALNAVEAEALSKAARGRARNLFSKVTLQQSTLRVYRELLD